MSNYTDLISRLNKKTGPINLSEIVELLEERTLPADALGPGSAALSVDAVLAALWRRQGVGIPGPLLAQIGDSRHANGILAAAPSFGRTMQSAGSWIEFLTHGRVRAPVSYNKAVGGTGTVDLDGQITQVLALSARPTHCAILTGTNAINNAASATGLMSAMQGHFIAAWSRLRAEGIMPITCLDLPRQWSDTTLTAAVKRRLHNQLNAWLRQAATKYGSLLIDPIWKLTDPTKASGECLESLYYSEALKIHPGPTGGYIIGGLYKSLFESMGLPPRYVGLGRGDTYDATDNAQGNLIPDGGTMAQSGGTVSGANPPTGTVPLGWILRNDTGAASLTSCVGSLEARSDGPGNWFKVVATTDGSGPATVLIYNQSVFGLVVGDTIQFGVDLVFDSSSGVNQCAVSVEDRNTGGASVNLAQYAMQFGSSVDIGAFQSTFDGRAITDPLTLGASFAVVRHGISVQLNPSSSVTLRIGAAEMRKVLATV